MKDWIAVDSQVIRYIRFPLILVIIFFHVRFSNVNFVDADIDVEHFILYDYLSYPFELIGHIGVPLFFFISGYLFFTKRVLIRKYISSIKKRVKSLLVPYVLWNIYS